MLMNKNLLLPIALFSAVLLLAHQFMHVDIPMFNVAWWSVQAIFWTIYFYQRHERKKNIGNVAI